MPSLIPVLFAGVLVHAAQKHLMAAKLQQLTALFLMKGYNAPLGIHPNAPQIIHNALLIHALRSLLRIRGCDAPSTYKTIERGDLFHRI